MAKYTKQVLTEAVGKSTSISGVLRELGLKITGGSHTNIKGLIKRFGIDTSHFLGQGHAAGKPPATKLAAKDVLVYNRNNYKREGRGILLRAMQEEGVLYECEQCGLLPEWAGKKLDLQIDHIDGDFLNNKIQNLRFLCPNCHTQTPTFGSKKPPVKCPCGVKISRKATRCRKCSCGIIGRKSSTTCAKRKKYCWPTVNKILSLVQEVGFTGAAKVIGCSDNAVRNHLKRNGVDVKRLKKI